MGGVAGLSVYPFPIVDPSVPICVNLWPITRPPRARHASPLHRQRVGYSGGGDGIGRHSSCAPPLASRRPLRLHTRPHVPISPPFATGPSWSENSHSLSGSKRWNQAVTSRLGPWNAACGRGCPPP